MKFFKSISIIIILFLHVDSVYSQKLEYSIFWGDDEIGSMKVSRIKKGSKTDFNFIADVEFRVLLKYNRTTEFKASYLNDTLTFCSSKSIMNEKLKDFQKTEKKDGFYEIFRHPEESDRLNESITHSVAMLYYEEPKSGLSKTYAEGHSKFCHLESLGSGQYKLHLDDDKTNIYKYQNGLLDEVEVKRTWFDLVFKRQ